MHILLSPSQGLSRTMSESVYFPNPARPSETPTSTSNLDSETVPMLTSALRLSRRVVDFIRHVTTIPSA